MYFSYKLKDHKATRTRKPCHCHDVRRADFQTCTSVRAAPALDSPIPVSGSEPRAAGQVASSAWLTRTEDTSPIFEVTVCPPGGVCQPWAALPQLDPGFLTSGDTGGSRRQEPCGEARRGARPWPCSWPRRCRGGWGPPGALPVSTHRKTSANQCFWTAAHFSKIFTRQSNCFEGESFCFERTASEATRPFSPCESVSMTK